METIGIRELRTQLSRHLKRVQAGAHLAITDRGRAVASLCPADTAGPSGADAWARGMVANGQASWGGGKPRDFDRVTLAGGPTIADTIRDDRR